MRRLALLLALVGVGLGIILYPQAAQWFELRQDLHLAQVVITRSSASGIGGSNLANQLEATPNSAADQEILAAAQAYNVGLTTKASGVYLESQAAADQEYQGQLQSDSATNAMGRVSIPKLDLSLPIFHGATDEELELGVGHVYGTSLPVGGSSTHAVLAAHSRLDETGRFSRLTELDIGDEFFITAAGQRLRYVVDQITVVLPSEVEAVGIVPGQDYVTLLTCTPPGINSHRLLVRGTRAELPVAGAGIAATALELPPLPFPGWAVEFGIGMLAAAGLGWLMNKALGAISVDSRRSSGGEAAVSRPSASVRGLDTRPCGSHSTDEPGIGGINTSCVSL